MADQENQQQNSPGQQSQGQSQSQGVGRERSHSTGTQERDKEAEREREKEDSSSQEEKREIVRQLFGDVGDLKRDFSCAVESSILLHGRMYVTKKFLCFYSNLFGLEKKIRVPYSHISVISKENTALVIPNAISITTFRKEYVFRSFWDRDECYNLIKELVEQVKGARGNTAASHEEANAASIITSSPPLSKQDKDKDKDKDKDTPPTSTVPSPSRPASTRLTSASTASSKTEDEYETEDSKRASTRVAAVMKNPEESFAQEVERSKLKVETTPVVMSGTLDDLFQKFIADDAPLSYEKYQSSTGDKDVVTTPWTDNASSSSSLAGFTRDMRFLKPVAIPSMPFARALMIQRYQRFGEYGLTIASSTRMEDVPYCDFFTVEVLLTVKVTGDNELTVMSYNEVKFIQSTMFRRFIEGNTNPDVKKWNEDFMVYMKENLSDKKGDNRLSTRKRAVTKPAAEAPPAPGPLVAGVNSLLDKAGLGPLPTPLLTSHQAFAVAWFTLLLVFLFFGWQWRAVRAEMRVLQQGVEALEAQGSQREQQRESLDALLNTLQRMRRHSEAVARVELAALPGGVAGTEEATGAFSYESFLDASSCSSSSASSARSAWLATLREQHPLLAEQVLSLEGLASAERALERALAVGGSSRGVSGDSDDIMATEE